MPELRYYTVTRPGGREQDATRMKLNDGDVKTLKALGSIVEPETDPGPVTPAPATAKARTTVQNKAVTTAPEK